MDEHFSGAINSADYWNKRFFEDWISQGGRQQTVFFAELCVRELPPWLIEAVRADHSSIFDYGCALGDALPIWQRLFPQSVIGGGDVAQVGLGLARALYPQFAFTDVNAAAEAAPLADLVYCSNTLEHFAGWRAVLDRLARHAERYIVVMVPFEEEDPIDEHAATFEFDSLPARLPGGHRLLHLAILDAAPEPETQWKGLQLIAVYGKAERRCGGAPTVPQRHENAMVFDLREAMPSAIAPLLANLASMSQKSRRLASELAATQAQNVRLASAEAKATDRGVILEATLKGVLREYRDLARGLERAQGAVIDDLTALDSELLQGRDIPPVEKGWPADTADDDAAHRATLARMIDAAHRGNRLALAFLDEVNRWQGERRVLTGRLRQARDAMERAIGERDRMRGPLPAGSRAAATGDRAPLVSIVLPVFNQAYLVEQAIAGVLSQTYQNWELVIVDDGSIDDLAERVRQYRGDRRVLFLRQPNQRLPAALNHGFARARGELLTWTSADNIMLPAQIERLVAELQAHPEAGLVYSDYWAIDDKGEPLVDVRWRHHNRDPEIADLIRLPDRVTIENFHKSGDNFIGASFLYRRSVAEIVGSYTDDAFGGEDYDFWLRMHLVTEFRHVGEALYKYRVHADTLTARAEDLRLFDNISDTLEADRWRIETILGESGLAPGAALLRATDQFHSVVLQRCCPIAYSDAAARDATGPAERPLVVDIDVPMRTIDQALLRAADILLCRSELTAALLRHEAWARDKRILAWQGKLTPAVHHAYVQAFAEQVTLPVTTPVSPVPARLDNVFRPRRILLLVDRWSAGGMENIVADLAQSLASGGCSVIVAAAHGAAPPAMAFLKSGANTKIRAMALDGDNDAFEALLRREAIDIVNYHHSRFGIATARALGIAAIYTMHNSYLWMDQAARAEVAAGLREMDQVIAVSRQVAQFASAQFGVPPERLHVIPNGLRAGIVAAATRPPAAPGTAFVIVMVASITRPKLQHIAIAGFEDAAAAIPAMRLRLIGLPLDPQYHRELETQIAASPLRERIELVGGLTRDETLVALAEAHVFLLPSLLEGCSIALLEAASAGCVCIASDVGSAADLTSEGGSVLLVPSPLGELEEVTQRQFLAAANSSLPQHRVNIADALRTVWRDYGAFAAGTDDTSARVRALADMRTMTEAYLDAYTLACRGGMANRQSAERTAALTSL